MAGVAAAFPLRHWPVRVYYEDTDSGGVVYHAQYLNFMERARTEWLRQLGFEQPQIQATLGVLFVVHSMELQFRAPAYFNDLLDVQSQLVKIGHGSMEFLQTIVRGQQVLLEAKVKLACVEAGNFRPTGIPLEIKRSVLTQST